MSQVPATLILAKGSPPERSRTMAVRITAVRLSQGGYLNEHITDVKWTS